MSTSDPAPQQPQQPHQPHQPQPRYAPPQGSAPPYGSAPPQAHQQHQQYQQPAPPQQWAQWAPPPQLASPRYPVTGSASGVNVPGLICLIVLGLHAVLVLATPMLYRTSGVTAGFELISGAVSVVAILFAIALIVCGAIGARPHSAPRLRWAAIGGLVCGTFDLVVQLGNYIVNWLAYGVFPY